MTPELSCFWFGASQSLDAAVHRGRTEDVAYWEGFITEHGKAPDTAWTLEIYGQVGVPAEFRRVDEAILESRVQADYGDTATVDDVRARARAERHAYLSAVRWNAENDRIRPGWRTLPGDPPAERDA